MRYDPFFPCTLSRIQTVVLTLVQSEVPKQWRAAELSRIHKEADNEVVSIPFSISPMTTMHVMINLKLPFTEIAWVLFARTRLLLFR